MLLFLLNYCSFECLYKATFPTLFEQYYYRISMKLTDFVNSVFVSNYSEYSSIGSNLEIP